MLEHLDTWRLGDGGHVPHHLKALSRGGLERGAQAAKAALSSLALTDAVLLLAPGALALASLRIGYDQVQNMTAVPKEQYIISSLSCVSKHWLRSGANLQQRSFQ